MNKNLGNKEFMRQLMTITRQYETKQEQKTGRISMPLPNLNLTANSLKNPLIFGLQQQMCDHHETFEDHPEF